VVGRIEAGDPKARLELVEYLTEWLNDHTRIADRMLGSFLGNHQRTLYKATFQAGTKPLDGGGWVTADGDAFHPVLSEKAPRKGR
jgi:hypothetical protein